MSRPTDGSWKWCTVWLSSCTRVATALDDCRTDKERMLPRCVIGPFGRPSTMCRVGSTGFVVVLALVLSTRVIRAQAPAAPAQPPPASPAGAANARALANQVNNPAAPVTLIQFRNVLLPDVEGADGATNEFQIQPVLPIGPFPTFPHPPTDQDHAALPDIAVADRRRWRRRFTGVRSRQHQGVVGPVGIRAGSRLPHRIGSQRWVRESGRRGRQLPSYTPA